MKIVHLLYSSFKIKVLDKTKVYIYIFFVSLFKIISMNHSVWVARESVVLCEIDIRKTQLLANRNPPKARDVNNKLL